MMTVGVMEKLGHLLRANRLHTRGRLARKRVRAPPAGVQTPGGTPGQERWVYRTSYEYFLLRSSRARKVRRVLLFLVVASWLIHSWIFSMAGLRGLGISGVCTEFCARVD